MKSKPKIKTSDVVHTFVKGAIGEISSTAAELFNLVIAPPLEKRRNEWIESIAEDLLNLQKKIDTFNIENLKSNELFLSVLLNSTQVAMRTHQIEKLSALRASILNTVIKPSIEEDVVLLFLNFIDYFTTWHLILLVLLNDPLAFAQKNSIEFPKWSQGGVGSVIEFVYPELKERRHFYDLLGQDLLSRGLIVSANFHNTITAESMLSSHTTQFGKDFIEYIVSPIDK
jgi:hypothetical protein